MKILINIRDTLSPEGVDQRRLEKMLNNIGWSKYTHTPRAEQTYARSTFYNRRRSGSLLVLLKAIGAILALLLALLFLTLLLRSCSEHDEKNGATGYMNSGVSKSSLGETTDESAGDTSSSGISNDASGDGASKDGSTSSDGATSIQQQGIERTGSERISAGESSWDGFGISNVDDIMSKTTMSEYAKSLFLHAAPMVVQEDEFRDEHYCGVNNDMGSSSVLGCYIPPKNGEKYTADSGEKGMFLGRGDDYIFIQKFDDKNLKEQLYVTAAHEMLHAGFNWFLQPTDNPTETVLKLLKDEYENGANSADLKDRMKPYLEGKNAEANSEEELVFYNELHSIIGTEYSNISPELEAYYKVYFDDRKKVVSYNNKVRCYLWGALCF